MTVSTTVKKKLYYISLFLSRKINVYGNTEKSKER
jgi:hypothetical protein